MKGKNVTKKERKGLSMCVTEPGKGTNKTATRFFRSKKKGTIIKKLIFI